MIATTISTTNLSSFAVAIADANALVLDGLATTDSGRAELFTQAKGRARDALAHTGVTEEQAFARQLLAWLALAEQQGWNI